MASTPVAYRDSLLNPEKSNVWEKFVPDEGDIVSDKGVRSIDGWVLLHFVLVGKDGGGRKGNIPPTPAMISPRLHGKVMSF
jgi:hypothetical protein